MSEREWFLEIRSEKPIRAETLAAVNAAYLDRTYTDSIGGFVSADGHTHGFWFMQRERRRNYLGRVWVAAWFRPLRYLLMLRLRLVRRPLRTGKILGVTIMSYVNNPGMTRLP